MEGPIIKRVSVVVAAAGLSILMLFVLGGIRLAAEGDTWQVHRNQIAPPVPPPVSSGLGTSWYGHMCAVVVTGTAGGTWTVRGSSGTLGDIQEYHTGTFDQWVLSRTSTSVTVKIASKAVLRSSAGFPLQKAQLPAEVAPYLQPTSSQQSNDPAIVSQAQALVVGAQTEAQAVVAILDWVRANISYDYTFQLPVDAVSVYRNRSGVCAGFSNLAVALLRAVGVPARQQVGCALWALPSGGGHAWIEVFYPDVGWVPSEPQRDQNFAGEHLVSQRWWEWCGVSTTSITYTQRLVPQQVYTLRTGYPDNIWPAVYSASVPSWDRDPASVSPSRLTYLVSVDETSATRYLVVESRACYSTTWLLQPQAWWIQVSPEQGATKTTVAVTVQAGQLPMGLSTSSITMTTFDTAPRSVPIEVRRVLKVTRTYLPLVSRN
jgi:transglutaminase-like putative cysteine protease